MPTSEPSASPSGCSCVTSTKRSPVRSASSTCCARLLRDGLGGAHAAPSPGRSSIGGFSLISASSARRAAPSRRCAKVERRRVLHAQRAGRPRAAGRRARSVRPSSAAGARLLVAEDAHEDLRVAQIGAGVRHPSPSRSRRGDPSRSAGSRRRAPLGPPRRHAASCALLILDPPGRPTDASVPLDPHLLGEARLEPAHDAVDRPRRAARADPPVSAAASVERCQTSWWSTSATVRPCRPWSCALTDCSSARLAFRLPASGKCRWTSSSATYALMTRAGLAGLLELALDLACLVDLEHVALLDVLEVREHDAALEALRRPRARRP